MTVMIWKEWQEQKWKIIAIWVIIAVAQIFRLIGEGEGTIELSRNINKLIGLAVVLVPLLMGLDTLCLERMRGTLGFLRSQPLSVFQILLPKFLVGSFGLFGAVFLLLGPMYFFVGMPMTEDQMVVARVTEMVPFWRLMWLCFITCWGYYVLSFTASVLTDNPVKAFFFSLLLFFGFAVLISHPGGGENKLLRVVVPFEDRGLAVLVANATPYLVMMSFAVLAFVAACFAICMGVFKRFHQFSLNWVVVLLLGALAIIFAKDFVDSRPAEAARDSLPIGVLALEGRQREMVKVGSHVYVSGKKGLSVVDVSNVAHPQLIGEVDAPFWGFGWSDASNHTVYGTGWHTEMPDSIKYAGVIAFDVRDPKTPRIKSELNLVNAKGIRQVGPVRVIGDYAYVCVVDERESRLVVVEDTGKELKQVYSLGLLAFICCCQRSRIFAV